MHIRVDDGLKDEAIDKGFIADCLAYPLSELDIYRPVLISISHAYCWGKMGCILYNFRVNVAVVHLVQTEIGAVSMADKK